MPGSSEPPPPQAAARRPNTGSRTKSRKPVRDRKVRSFRGNRLEIGCCSISGGPVDRKGEASREPGLRGYGQPNGPMNINAVPSLSTNRSRDGAYRRRIFSAISIWTTLPSWTTRSTVPNLSLRRTSMTFTHDRTLLVGEVREVVGALLGHGAATLPQARGRTAVRNRRGTSRLEGHHDRTEEAHGRHERSVERGRRSVRDVGPSRGRALQGGGRRGKRGGPGRPAHARGRGEGRHRRPRSRVHRARRHDPRRRRQAGPEGGGSRAGRRHQRHRLGDGRPDPAARRLDGLRSRRTRPRAGRARAPPTRPDARTRLPGEGFRRGSARARPDLVQPPHRALVELQIECAHRAVELFDDPRDR